MVQVTRPLLTNHSGFISAKHGYDMLKFVYEIGFKRSVGSVGPQINLLYWVTNYPKHYTVCANITQLVCKLGKH